MYTWFYGFPEEPFNVSPDPRFLLLTETHRQALHSMVSGIDERRGFVVILGEFGTGKTTLIQHLLNTINKKVKAVPIFHPQDSLEELLEDVLRELGVPAVPQNRVSLVRQLNDYLRGLGEDETLALIIDEAQDLSPEMMDGLRLLPTPEMADSKKLQVLFVGQPEFAAKLDAAPLKELQQKIETVCQIRPLEGEECQQYIAHRLNRVESHIHKIFTPEAIALICRHCKGNPRTINILCDNSFLIGYGLSKKRIDFDIVTEVMEDLDLIGQEETKGWQPPEVGKFRATARREKNSLFRKIAYSLMALVGVGAIIFLGRIYWKGPERQLAIRFPIQPPMGRDRMALVSPEVSPGRVAKGIPRSEGEPGAPVPEGKRSVPPPSGESRPSPPLPAVERKAAVPAPAQPAEDKKELEPGGAVMKTLPAPPGSQMAVAKSKAEMSVGRAVVARTGDSLYSLAAKAYKVANTSIVDQILEFNPQISSPNRLLANQKIKLPEITEEALIIEFPGGAYSVLLGTFLKPEYASFLKDQPSLQGKEIEILPRKLPSGETWYRAVAGKFNTREEGLKVIHNLREKGLSPYFSGFRKKK